MSFIVSGSLGGYYTYWTLVSNGRGSPQNQLGLPGTSLFSSHKFTQPSPFLKFDFIF